MGNEHPDMLADTQAGQPARNTSLDYLLARIALVEQRVRSALARKASFGANPSDPLRGLYISDQDIEALLASPPATHERLACRNHPKALEPYRPAAPGETEPDLVTLCRVFRLAEIETEFLLIAVAPDLDRRFERFYGYLNDNVSQRRATIGLALELCELSPADCGAVASLSEGGTLLDEGLVVVQEPEQPFLGRSLRVPDHVRAYLLGDHRLHPDLQPWVVEPPPLPVGAGIDAKALRLERGQLLYVQETRGGSARSAVASGLAELGRHGLFLNLASAGPTVDVQALLRLARVCASLAQARLIVGPVERLLSHGSLNFLGLEGSGAIIFGRCPWEPTWSAQIPVLLTAPPLPLQAQQAAWMDYLGAERGGDIDLLEVAAPFRLDPEQMQRAARSARLQAEAEERPLCREHLVAGARAQGTAGLERLARRIDPSACWDDLVLPPDTVEQLRELSGRVRTRQRVLDSWGLRRCSRGESVAALFAGESGTGKTMSAEVLASDLGLYLYVVNLAAVVDKYIGETEKNLDRIFVEAENASCVLLFDEADALFGKRSDVKDAHDRYANTETAYLLQRMEEFGGIAILSTNLRSNLDDAFTRRLDSVVEFTLPTPELRRQLWARCMGEKLPRSADVDIPFLAEAFEISGGSIRNIVVTAAHLAAAAHQPVSMSNVIKAAGREYRKLGRLCREDNFGPYYQMLS
jgi:hypothetical protein